MRKYPIDSPEAAARIVALALMADGVIDRSETLLLERHEVVSRLGLSNEQFDTIYYDYSTDMLTSGFRKPSGRLELDEQGVNHLLEEIANPELQKKILRIMLDIVNADHRLVADEAALIAQALKQWGMDLCGMSESSMPRHCPMPEKSSISALDGSNIGKGVHRVASG